MVQFSHPYMTTGKTIALTKWTFVGKVISLLFNMLSRFVIAFLSRKQASFNFMAVVTICSDFGAQKNLAQGSSESLKVDQATKMFFSMSSMLFSNNVKIYL